MTNPGEPQPAGILPLGTVRERDGQGCTDVPLRFGVPLPRGFCHDPRRLRLLVGHEPRLQPAHFDGRALWPDRSLRWVLLDSTVRLDPGEALPLQLATGPAGHHRAQAQSPVLTPTRDALRFEGERGGWSLPCGRFCPPMILCGDRPLGTALRISNAAGTPLNLSCRGEAAYRTLHGEQGAERIEVTLAGEAHIGAGRRLLLRLRYDTHPASGRVEAVLTLHNPAAAEHPDGLWDLGDPGSVVLSEVSLVLECPDAAESSLVPEPGSPQKPLADGCRLTQWSSGGEHWDSPVHRNAAGEVPWLRRGYTIEDRGGRVIAEGLRAEPILFCDTPDGRLALTTDTPWQQFPMRFARAGRELVLSLFADGCGDVLELQGGEQKSWRFRWQLTSPEASTGFTRLEWQPDPALASACDLPELGDPGRIDPRLLPILREGLEGPGNFLEKREQIDEYGWRHFGDLYADHENDRIGALPDGSRERLVSHYNNQYDPIFGFLRLYLLTGDPRWFRLGDELARHVRDIDIYHTTEDRPEYNEGLFWHTDHYLDAGTATHRSYSRLQPADAYEGHARGGGPGGQHCYTTGLLYHYLLTGEEDSRDAALGLVRWIGCVYDGSGTLTDWMLALRNRHRRDLRNPLSGRYPLDRGTGNYVQALLDAHYLLQSPTLLRRAGAVILATAHPGDDLVRSDLLNAEDHWYYTVFLQAVCRFLETKESCGELDDEFRTARDLLLHYAHWMAEHERPYLDQPETLEFPNATWIAQDLRKARVLEYAARVAPDPTQAEALQSAAKRFADYVATRLSSEPTRHYTRIQALLMQNLLAAPPSRSVAAQWPVAAYPPTQVPGPASVAARVLGELLQALRRLSLRDEWHGLRTRFPALARLGKRP